MGLVDHHRTGPADVPTRRTPLPLVHCTTFCQRTDGHPDEIFPADQQCMSRSERGPVGFHGAGVESYATGTTSGDALVTVSAEHPGGCVQLSLTIEEAERYLTGPRRVIAGPAAAVLTVGGRIVLDVPGGIDALPTALRAAGLAIDEIRGVVAPADPAEVEAIVSTRFGSDAASLYHALRRGCPGEIVDPVVATTLVDDAREVLHVCRKLPRPSAPERRTRA